MLKLCNFDSYVGVSVDLRSNRVMDSNLQVCVTFVLSDRVVGFIKFGLRVETFHNLSTGLATCESQAYSES